MSTTTRTDVVRLALSAEGVVQGVGLRPWCARQAEKLTLTGWVRNDARGLRCELQGRQVDLDAFVQALRREPPPLTRIDHLDFDWRPSPIAEAGFRIRPSSTAGVAAAAPPVDTAACPTCLDELFDPADRRYRYPFIHCAHCGPRYTLTHRLPYDRSAISMARFVPCPACTSEYTDLNDRRCHTQSLACPRCGPRVALSEAADPASRLCDQAAIDRAAALIGQGAIVAIKSVGGYQLLCDARDGRAVTRLRQSKRRPAKPFALLTPNVASARRWVDIDSAAAELLESAACPIVLLACGKGASQALPGLAPGLSDWAIGLPPSPLHWLLLHAALGWPTDRGWRDARHPLLWVMTSANDGGEPLLIDDDEAMVKLTGHCDAILLHDRPIVARTDDSVLRAPASNVSGQRHAPFVRRARGYAPQAITLPGVASDAPPVLAVGPWLKNTICVTRGNLAFVSPHIGDLSSATACRALVLAVESLCGLLAVQPTLIAHDRHPDFFSTRHAQALAAQWRVPTVGVQHHHAHAAAVAAEHGLHEALAVVLDGTGLGDTDDAGGGPSERAWGGELLHLRASAYERLSHLPTLPMPGGERAAREPWRMGAAVLAGVGRHDQITERFADRPLVRQVTALLCASSRVPRTSSAGRLFDAAAALIDNLVINDYDGHAAMRLEALARPAFDRVDAWPQSWRLDDRGAPVLSGLLEQLTAPPPASHDALDDWRAEQAARFHRSFGQMLIDWITHHHRVTGRRLPVVLGGGCWVNALLRRQVVDGLRGAGMKVFEATALPCGDGGISLGQAAVALWSATDHDEH